MGSDPEIRALVQTLLDNQAKALEVEHAKAERQEKIWYLLTGNGDPERGILSRVIELEKQSSQEKDEEKKRQNRREKLLWILVTALAGSVTTQIIVAVFK